MKFKVTLTGDNYGYYEIVDEEEYYLDIVEDSGKEEADKYFKCGTFYTSEIKNHYLYGFIECLSQSDHCPPLIYQRGIINCSLERVD